MGGTGGRGRAEAAEGRGAERGGAGSGRGGGGYGGVREEGSAGRKRRTECFWEEWRRRSGALRSKKGPLGAVGGERTTGGGGRWTGRGPGGGAGGAGGWGEVGLARGRRVEGSCRESLGGGKYLGVGSRGVHHGVGGTRGSGSRPQRGSCSPPRPVYFFWGETAACRGAVGEHAFWGERSAGRNNTKSCLKW